jgi:hypothetical protein
MKKKYLYNQNNNESISLLNNLKEEKNQNYSYKRKEKSMKIIKVANNKEINKKINNNEINQIIKMSRIIIMNKRIFIILQIEY